MNVVKEVFGMLHDGREIDRYWLTGEKLKVAVLSYGAAIQKIEFEGKDLILGYDNLEGYLNGKSYQGASIE